MNIRNLKRIIPIVFSMTLIACSSNTEAKIETTEIQTETSTEVIEESKEKIMSIEGNLSDKGMKINKGNKEILKALEKKIPGNIVFSNTGIQSVLAMVNFAANNDTKKQIDAVNGDFKSNLNSDAVNIYNFLVANEKQENAKAKESFVDTLKNEDWIKADLYEITNNTKLEELVDTINNKISDETNGQIKDAVKKETYSSDDFVMQLGNVIHFFGSWEHATKDKPYKLKNYYFNNKDGKKVPSEFVVIRDGDARLVENNDIIGMTMDYKEDNFRYKFVIFLPKDENNFSLDKINVEDLNYFVGMRYHLNARFPKFEFNNDLKLTDILIALGVKDLFDVGKADLSNGFDFDRNKFNVYASSCSQKSVIRVDEYGTEASAFTSIDVALMTSAREPQKVKVRYVDLTYNRPFYFMVYDSKENLPLFIGEVNTLENSGKQVEAEDENVETIVDKIVEEEEY